MAQEKFNAAENAGQEAFGVQQSALAAEGESSISLRNAAADVIKNLARNAKRAASSSRKVEAQHEAPVQAVEVREAAVNDGSDDAQRPKTRSGRGRNPRTGNSVSSNQRGGRTGNAGSKSKTTRHEVKAEAKSEEIAPASESKTSTKTRTSKTRDSKPRLDSRRFNTNNQVALTAPNAPHEAAALEKNAVKKDGSARGKLQIIPLGGLGEVGKNMTAFKFGNNIIVVDGGMTFPDEEQLGIDLVIPDYNYLLENKSMVRGIFVTHGHEDHIGALPYVLKDLKVPVYGSRLSMGLLKGKLKEHNLSSSNLHDVSAGDTITAGPFKVEFIHVSHSIPDSMALAIHTPVGVCLHTGDFKIDMSPIDNQFMDLTRISELGQEGVLLLMADSTNVERPGFTASEKSVGQSLDTIFLNATGRIIVTTFASNVHRIQQAIWAAERTGRKVAVVGRGMNNVVTIANELGYLKVKANTFIDINDIKKYPDRKLAILTTGSQGETLAGLTRMSTGEHRQVHLHPGDLVVISANPIPGNEKMISRTVDNLYHMGVDVAYGRSLGIHVSGHASQEDLKLIFNLVRPKFFMPVHGEYRMLCEHGKLANHMGLPAKNVFIMENGQVLEMSARSAKVNGKVHSGQVLIDGRGIGDVGTTVLKDRKQLSNDGIVIASIVIDRYECRLNSVPYIFSRGFVYEKGNDTIFREAEKRIVSIVEGMSSKDYNQSALKAGIKQAIARLCFERTGRKPIIVPIINEI